MERCLGKLPARRDARTLNLLDYIQSHFSNPPAARHWETGISDFGVMGNDRYGNCVIVTAGHMRLTWRANELDDTARISDADVVALSQTMGALNGYAILDRLKYWRKTGMWGNKLWAFMELDQRSENLIKIAVDSFGAADIGLMMPAAWKSSEIWRTGTGPNYRPNSWGGHSVPVVGYDELYCYVITWGEIQRITWDAIGMYSDEAYATINPDWLAADALTPSGFDLAKLHADLQTVTQ